MSKITAGDLGEGEYIGIGLGKIPGAGDHKQLLILVQQNVHILAKATGGVEFGNGVPVFFPVVNLRLDIATVECRRSLNQGESFPAHSLQQLPSSSFLLPSRPISPPQISQALFIE